MKNKKKPPVFHRLGELSPQFEGWIIDHKGIHSPEGELFDEARLRYFHWQWQIMGVLRHRINHPEQFNLF